jgi:hypothetical protein
MNLHLSPPRQPMPGNVWHFLLNAALAFGMMLLTWMHGLDFLRSESPLTPSESTLLLVGPDRSFDQRGDPHPVLAWIEILNQEADLPPLLANRLLSLAASLGSLWVMASLLGRQTHWLSATACCVLFLILPGMALQAFSAAGGTLGVWFFLLALSACARTEGRGHIPFAGVCVALATFFHPAWFFPALGIPLGLWETDRRQPLRFLGAWAATLLPLLALGAWMDWTWFVHNLPVGPLPETARARDLLPLPQLALRFLPLAAGLPLMLWLGRDRRGVGWWTLLMALPPALFANRFFTEPVHGLLPLLVFLLLGLVRLPMLLGIRFPGTYQSVFGLQGLLWLSVYLGTATWAPFPGPRQATDALAWSALKSRIRDAPGPVLGNAGIVSRLQRLAWVYRVRDLAGDDAARQRVEKALANGSIAYVLLREDGDPLPPDLARLVREHYEPAGGEAGFVLWIPAILPAPSSP